MLINDVSLVRLLLEHGARNVNIKTACATKNDSILSLLMQYGVIKPEHFANQGKKDKDVLAATYKKAELAGWVKCKKEQLAASLEARAYTGLETFTDAVRLVQAEALCTQHCARTGKFPYDCERREPANNENAPMPWTASTFTTQSSSASSSLRSVPETRRAAESH